MTNKDFEKNLKGFDYSEFSKVKENLLADILRQMYKDNLVGGRNLSQGFTQEILTDEELDYAAAAGNPFTKDDLKEKN